jgi:ankyrin repeat protein
MRYVIAGAILIVGICVTMILRSREARENSLFNNAESDNLGRVQFLVTHGANINEVNNKVFGFTPLIIALYHENADVANYLIDSGANVNLADKWGVTPLMHAVLLDDREVTLVQHLIDRGANIAAKDNNGNTVFSYAKANTKVWLLLSNANSNEKDNNGLPRR